MMKKILLFLLLLLLPMALPAQGTQPQPFRFGYLSYEQALKAMPDYALAERHFTDLRSKYDAEMQRAEDEFKKKYENFLENQTTFAPSIRQKRQLELEDLVNKNMAFKQEAQRLLEQARTETFGPVEQKLQAAISRIGQRYGLAFVLNTDNNSVPFLNRELGLDLEPLLKEALQ